MNYNHCEFVQSYWKLNSFEMNNISGYSLVSKYIDHNENHLVFVIKQAVEKVIIQESYRFHKTQQSVLTLPDSICKKITISVETYNNYNMLQ